MKFAIQISYKDIDNSKRHSAISVEAKDTGEAYREARKLIGASEMRSVNYGACIPGEGVII